MVDQNGESGALYRRIKRLDPSAHSAEFKASRRLPFALSLYGLMPPFRSTPPAPPGAAASS